MVFKAGLAGQDAMPAATEETAKQALARAMHCVLARAAESEIVVVVPANAEEALDAFSPATSYLVITCSDEAQTWLVAQRMAMCA